MFESIRLDAADTVFFTGDLEAKRAAAVERHYPELKGRKFVPVGTNYDPGCETISYDMFDHVGVAKIVANYATDFPRVNVSSGRFPAPVKSLGDSFGYSIMDIRRARMAGVALEQRNANAAFKVIMEADDRIIALGDAGTGLVGMLNHANVPIVAVIPGVGGNTWALKTAAEILRDLNFMETSIGTNTQQREQPDTILLPPAEYTRAAQTPMFAGQPWSIIDFFLSKSQGIRNIDSWAYLTTAGAGGVQRAMAYKRDADYIEHPVPQDFEYPTPPQLKGMEIEQICHSRVGGVINRFPLACVYMDGL